MTAEMTPTTPAGPVRPRPVNPAQGGCCRRARPERSGDAHALMRLQLLVPLLGWLRHALGLTCFSGDPGFGNECSSLSYCLMITSRWVLGNYV